ncbi:Ku70/Ku80, N-terminal alpha/beta,SPOC-like, C-terminal domain,Ku70/Ku80 C-terminal arm,von Willebrand [Cinara cedri]|uniref:Ku70/Ku80, N-terminal alpha/beta,SPOC-like, C-terminal domain,Ku70/Ku80 C-terminal arm,von Willebrand n=1 Tax=Cinara cedri TaxID=506608 RepID=A0A5E4NBP0_9HEMI|nr:Ku70/Ku80, N-terminal alpha/beta,SPOC-like, C-terminal domain,Ku70/Ku80 C-terminal arm,von Willebrand [Cinara cedri]
MAPVKKKEAIILSIDIGKNSLQLDSDGKTYFEKALFCASMILQRKLLTESKDDLALILFGSSQTNNPFSSNGNCYKNIEIVTSLGAITWDLLQHITNLSSTDITPSDWLSTLVIATDMLKKESDDKIFSDLQIVMFSNLPDGVSLDKIDNITRCIQQLSIKLTIIGCEYTSFNPVLETFITDTKATCVDFDSVLHQLSHCKPKETTPRAWNVPLGFGNVFSIKVSGYKKIDEVPKGFKWLLCKNYDTEDSITPVQKHTSFYYVDNGVQKEVDHDHIIDGFRFGDTIVPVSNIDIDAYGYKSGPKSLQVLGFTKSKNIQRSFLMDGGSYIFKPDVNDFIAFNSIFKAMVEREEIMIVRKVYCANSMPNIGAMFPQTEDDENYFVYVNLPYAEDEHLFKLPSLKLFKPNAEQKIAVHGLINAMDLDDDEDELFLPENTYNPELQYMYYCIVQKAINKDKPLIKTIPKNIQNFLYPNKNLMEQAKHPINMIKELFSLVPKIDEKKLLKNNVTSKVELGDEKEYIKKPCVISAYNPVEDFNKLLEEGIESNIVCETMKTITVELIESSTTLDELKKPASNLKALRQFYIHNKDINSYNNWMYHVKDSVLLSGKENMWSQFIDSGIGLITNQEVEISDISQELSEEFMKHEEPEDITAEYIIDDDDPLKEFL